MTRADFEKFKKLMARTVSEYDPEALSALRQANYLLKRNELTWERVLDRSVRVEHPFEESLD